MFCDFSYSGSAVDELHPDVENLGFDRLALLHLPIARQVLKIPVYIWPRVL